MPVPGITTLGSGEPLDLVPTIYSEFKLLRDYTGVMRSCATHMTLRPHEGPTKNVLNYGRLIAYDVADAVDIAQAQTLSDSSTAFSPGEVAVQTILAGSTMRRAPDPDLLRRAGRILQNTYDLKEDTDGTAQLPSFTPIIGAATVVIGLGHLLGAGSRLAIGNDRANPEPGPKPWYAVLHPMHAGIVVARLIPLNQLASGSVAIAIPPVADQHFVATGHAGGMQAELIRRGIGAIGGLFDALVKQDANIAVDASDDASGAFFSQEGLVFVSEVEPRLDPEDKDKSMRGAVELNLWGSHVWGLYRPANYGIELLFDASLPTS